jgi:HlyD family secretion protein
MNSKTWKALIAAGVIGTTTAVGAFYSRGDTARPVVTAEPVTRGDIVTTIAATGTLEAVTTVEVGTQVSGSIRALDADFNSIVRKGQVLAELDPSLYRSAVEQAHANVLGAEANQERLQVAAVDAETKLARAQVLSAKQLISRADLETAEVAVRSAAAQVKSAAAQLAQARASLRQAEVNLAKTIITSPIDGIVIARNVDVGQTVAASLSAPTLFVLAADLTQMQLKANIDEADLGRIVAGQPVEFTVDAYPTETFTGSVRQVRLNPVVASNVVTYAAIITAPNPDLKLKPGMTANLNVEVERRENVLRVPSAALRYTPTAAVLSALESMEVKPPAGARVWQHVDGRLVPVGVAPGATNGSHTEVKGGSLQEGAQVVTRVADAQPTTPQTSGSSSPLIQRPPSGPMRR